MAGELSPSSNYDREHQAMVRGLTRGSRSPGGAWLVIADKKLHEQLIAEATENLPEETRLIFTRHTLEEYWKDGSNPGIQTLLGGQTGIVNPHHIVVVATSEELTEMLQSENPFVKSLMEDAMHRWSGNFDLSAQT